MIPLTGVFSKHLLEATVSYRLDQLVQPGKVGQVIGVALSGGADSLALLCLAQHWAQTQGVAIVAITVDHGLRLAAKEEASAMMHLCRQMNIAHHTLVWENKTTKEVTQQSARDARYDLLGAFAIQRGLSALLVGHQKEDQRETFLLRLTGQSGPKGLAGMPWWRSTPWVPIIRPLLDVEPWQLKRYLMVLDLQWIEDPSNTNLRFKRVKIRKLLESDPALRPWVDQALSVYQSNRSQQQLKTYQAYTKWSKPHPLGWCTLDIKALEQLDHVTCLDVMSEAWRMVSGNAYPPSFKQLERVLKENPKQPFTLGGCYIVPKKEGWLMARERHLIHPEPLTLQKGAVGLWDRRFRLHNQGNDTVIEKMVHAKREQWHNEELASYLAQTLPCRGDRIIVDALGTDALHVAFVGNTTLDWLFVSS